MCHSKLKVGTKLICCQERQGSMSRLGVDQIIIESRVQCVGINVREPYKKDLKSIA